MPKAKIRNYTVIVTVTVISPEGKRIETAVGDVTVPVDLRLCSTADADDYMREVVPAMLTAATHNIENFD